MKRRITGCALLLVAAAGAGWAAAVHPAHLLTVRSLMPALDLVFGVSGLARPLLTLLAIVVPPVALWTFARGEKSDAERLAYFTLSMMLVLLARSVAAFVFSWELMALLSALLVGTHHEERSVRRALFSYLAMSQLGALCIIGAFALLAVHAQDGSFTTIASIAGKLDPAARNAALALALVGFGSKAGLVPLHSWLPRAHPAAPANASALLSGAMLGVAIYGMMLFMTSLAPAGLWWGLTVFGLGLVTAVAGALYGAVDTDLKRMLAYSSIENTGLIVASFGLSLAAFASNRPTVGSLAFAAAFFQLINHGVFKSALFLAGGSIAKSTGTTDLERLGGLGAVLPYSAPAVLAACTAAAALPPFGAFASEWLIFRSLASGLAGAPDVLAMSAVLGIAAVALASGIAAAMYAKLFGIGFFGYRRAHWKKTVIEKPDLSTAALWVLALSALVFGVAPSLMLRPLGVGAGALVTLPASLVVFPLVAVAAALVLVRLRGVREVPTWTCGSVVTRRSQYTATAFTKPVRLIFGFVLFPERERIVDAALPASERIVRYEVRMRFVVDEWMRAATAFTARVARRARIVQSGQLRVYLAYAVAAVIVMLVVAR
jgi:hydrogenase-4 component B